MAPRSLDKRPRWVWFSCSMPARIARYWSQRPSFTFELVTELKPLTIAVLNGGINVGCKKYRRFATAGPSPLIATLSIASIPAMISWAELQQEQW